MVRWGKILQMVEERLGAYGATVLATILSLGHAKISYLETLPELHPQGQSTRRKAPKTNGPNGDHHKAAGPQLHIILRSLAAHGYIMRVRDAQFQSPEDNHEHAERVVKSREDIRGLKGKKLQEALDEGVKNLIKERTDGAISKGLFVDNIHRGVKRRVGNKGQSWPNKRVKFRHAVEAEGGDEDEFSGEDYVDDIIPMGVSDL